MKTDPLPPILLLGLIAGLCLLPTAVRAADNANPPVPIFNSPQSAGTGQPAAAVQNTLPAAHRLSAGLDEIVKLNKAGVDEGVILAFIQNSPVAYRPSAQEILMLRDGGISSPILNALLQRGGEVRQQAMDSARPPQAAAPAPGVVNPPEPTPVQPATAHNGDPAAYSAASPTVVYASDPSYGYGGYGYPYYYPGYYGYYGGWYPGLSIGFGFGGGYYGGAYCGGYYGGHGGRVYPVHGHGGSSGSYSSGSITGAKGNAGYAARNSGGQVSTVKGSGGYSGGYTAARVSSIQGGSRSGRH